MRSLAVLLALVLAAHAQTPVPVLHPKAAPLPTQQQGPFVTTGDGGILLIDEQNAQRSSDEGKTWTSTPLFRDAKKFKVSAERALLRTRDGVVISAWMNMVEMSSPKGWKWGEAGVNWRDFVLPIYVMRSLDDGKTWEEPILINKPWCGCIHSIIETKSGRIVLVGQEIIPEWRHATTMFVSDDKGKTWQRSNSLDYGLGMHDHAGSLEGTVVERKDGSLYLLLRTEKGFLWEATSADGLKWEGLKQTEISSVTCCPQLMRIADGRIALLWNKAPRHDARSRTSREELFLAFSTDECATWSKPVVVAGNYGNRARVSYPYLYERKPGEFWITTMQGGLRMKVNAADLAKAELPVHVPPPKPTPKPGSVITFGDSTTAERGGVKRVYTVRLGPAFAGITPVVPAFNAGIPGNTTKMARARFEKDVLVYKPRVVVIQLGINDSAVDVWKTPSATASRVSVADYETNLRFFIAELRKINAKPILMTTNPLRWTAKLKEMYGKPPYNPDDPKSFETTTLARYNDTIRKLAKELDVPLVDVHAAYDKVESVDALLLDGMHPNDNGHQLVADLLVPVLREQLR